MADTLPFDDQTLTTFAEELQQEFTICSNLPIPSDTEIESWAKEISAEKFSSTSQWEMPTNIAKGPTKRIAGMPSTFRGQFGMTGAGVRSSSTFGRASFSNRSVQAKATGPDEFDRSLLPKDVALWRKITKRDEKRIRSFKSQPLSRFYRGDTTPVKKLNVNEASRLAAEHVVTVSKQMGLSPEMTQTVEKVASDSGEQYVDEIKSLIKARLQQDSNFDAKKYPAAAKLLLK